MRWLVLVAAIVQIAVPFFVNPFTEGHAEVRRGGPASIEPAGYAFSIWGVIYLAALGYALWQSVGPGRTNPLAAQIAPFAVALYLGSSLWLCAAQYGPLWATMPILAVMAACAVTALIIASSPGGDAARFWIVAAPFALYAGWTVCASFVNVAVTGPMFGFARFGLSEASYAVLSIGAAVTLAVAVLAVTRGQPVFAATIVWALVAIIVAGLDRDYGRAAMITAGAGIVVTAVAAAVFRLRG